LGRRIGKMKKKRARKVVKIRYESRKNEKREQENLHE